MKLGVPTIERCIPSWNFPSKFWANPKKSMWVQLVPFVSPKILLENMFQDISVMNSWTLSWDSKIPANVLSVHTKMTNQKMFPSTLLWSIPFWIIFYPIKNWWKANVKHIQPNLKKLTLETNAQWVFFIKNFRHPSHQTHHGGTRQYTNLFVFLTFFFDLYRYVMLNLLKAKTEIMFVGISWTN